MHTSGPWTVEDRRNAALKNVRIVAGSHQVAEVSDVHQRDYQGSFRGDHAAADAVDAVGLANASLIAASPDGHAILTELRRWYMEGSATPFPSAMFDENRTWKQALDDYFSKAGS